eukprot:COSAG06_NODE_62739_length_264_cov_0.630303_1_plen_29_part_10
MLCCSKGRALCTDIIYLVTHPLMVSTTTK